MNHSSDQFATVVEHRSRNGMHIEQEATSAIMNSLAWLPLDRCQSPSEMFFNPWPLETSAAVLDSNASADGVSHSISDHSVCREASADSSEGICVDRGSSFPTGFTSHFKTDLIQQHASMKYDETSGESVLGNVWSLATTPDGCRSVQTALDVGDNAFCVAIASELRGRIWDAVRCQHGNHVLQKCITKLTPPAFQFIVDELGQGQGFGKHLARHRYGCRVFERLLEHCLPSQVQGFIDDVLGAATALCAHPFANYVMQHILEHGTCDNRRRLVAVLIDEMPRVAGARHAPAVLSKAVALSCGDVRGAIARALLLDPSSLLRLASDRFGHVAVEDLLRDAGGKESALRLMLLGRVADLKVSRYGQAIDKQLQKSSSPVNSMGRLATVVRHTAHK